MKNGSKFNLKLSAITLGVLGLFAVSSAMADDEEIKALTQPQSTVQVEVIGVDQNSAKFGEYNGLYGHPSGAYPNGALNVRGGSAYTNNEQGETTRWSVTGDNLGLTSRSANASIADQGSWNFGVNFDQLQHNITNSYQTPYQGTMGGNRFVLPSNLQNTNIVDSASKIPGDLGAMTISTTRYNTTVSGAAIVDKNLNFTFEYNNLIQTGAKLQAFSGATIPTGASSGNGSSISILPNPTNYTTDTVNLAANWKNDNAHFTASYFGSFFNDGYNGVNWQVINKSTGGTTTPIQTMSTMPSNAFNQLNLNGGYDFSNKTKLTANLSAGQNTQNQGYSGSYDPGMVIGTLPAASMNGLVNTTHADVKLTDQSIKDLTLGAMAKFDLRDNLSQSNMYNFNSIAAAPNSGQIPNTPMSFKQNQLALSGDYRITKDQRVGLVLANNAVDRWCNQYGTPGTTVTSATGGLNTYNSYYNSASCVSATSSNENKADLTYKLKASESVSLKFAGGYSNRKTQWNQNAIVALPLATEISYPSAQPVGYNSGNVLGFQPFFEASRKQFVGKANATWQADDKLSFTVGGKYTNDIYPDSTYGVQNGYSWSLNLDSTYAYAEAGSLVAYVTQQNQQRSASNANTVYTAGALTALTTWQNNLKTNATTFGVGVRQGELLDGKLLLTADATVSLANSIYSTNTQYAGSVSSSNCSAATTQTCGILPGIQNNMAAIKLGGNYQLDKNSKVGLMYWYQHLYSNDWLNNPYQVGYTPSGVMPTNQSSNGYSVNVISANYTYTFD